MTRPDAAAGVAVVVPCRNAVRYLPVTLPALLKSAEAVSDAVVVVVDNGSTDGTLELLAALTHPRLLVCSAPGLVGAVRNAGVRASSAALVAFVDADCLVRPDFVATVHQALSGVRRQVVGAAYLLPEEPRPIERTWFHLHPAPPDGPAAWLYGGDLALARADFDAVGGFREDMVSGEDIELCARLSRAGCEIRHRADLAVRHLGNPVTMADFYRQQRWHAVGYRGRGGVRADRPTMLALGHGLLLAIAVTMGGVAAVRHRWAWVGVAIGLTVTLPVLAVFYRIAQGGKARPFARAVGLYFLYLTARLHTLVSPSGVNGRGAP